MWTISYLVRPTARPTEVTDWRPSKEAALALAGELSGLVGVLAISLHTPEGHLFTAW